MPSTSYDEFGRRFFALVVNEERVLAGVNTLANQTIDVGPIGVGPGRIAKVTAQGRIGSATAVPIPGEAVAYRVTLPIDLDFTVHLQLDTQKFHATLEVPLILTALAIEDLRIFIDVAAPLPYQVRVKLRSDGLRASLLSKAVKLENELQRFVARYVTRELAKPEIMRARVIDVLGRVDRAWSPETAAEPAVIADLDAALEADIAEHAPAFLEELTEGGETS